MLKVQFLRYGQFKTPQKFINIIIRVLVQTNSSATGSIGAN